jgi:hypothetical protein
VESHHVARPGGLVGHDDLELVAIDAGNEEIQLHRLLVATRHAAAYRDESVALLPALRLPVELEERLAGVESPPVPTAFDLRFELGKAFEGDRDGELHTQLVEPTDDGVAEKRAIHAGLDLGLGQGFLQLLDTGAEEAFGAIRVVHIAGTMEDVKDLTRLGDGTKQRVVAALSPLGAVEPDRGTFGPAASADNRTVAIQRHPPGTEDAQPVAHELTVEKQELGDAVGVGSRQ